MTDRPGAVPLPPRPEPPGLSVEFENVDFGRGRTPPGRFALLARRRERFL